MSNTSSRPIRVRMAPSPTGSLHFGTARTALFNWLFARAHGGTFVVRIEDTDKERSEKKFETEILEGFLWLGLDWDEGPARAGAEKGTFGPYHQSDRTAMYKKYLEQLLHDGHAYYCYCTKEDLEAQRQAMLSAGLPPKYNGHCRNLHEAPTGKKPEVIRFKIPEVTVEFKDLVRGTVAFDAMLLGDQVIAKDLDTPLYNFAVVVDDELMQISHVIRGEDHLSNTPKQILMQKALSFTEPVYAHIPLILNADRSKMSKRLNDVSLMNYREKGYLPEAIMNFMALLGWHPKGDKEVMAPAELIKEFDISRVQQAGAIFNEDKLQWLNKEHMKALSDDRMVDLLMSYIENEHSSEESNSAGESDALPKTISRATLENIVAIGRTRASTLRDFMTQGKFFFQLPDYDASLLVWKNMSMHDVAPILVDVKKSLDAIVSDDFRRELINEVLAGVIAQVSAGGGNRGSVLWPLRVALSGQSASPDPLDIMDVLGKTESLRRIEVAIKKLATASTA